MQTKTVNLTLSHEEVQLLMQTLTKARNACVKEAKVGRVTSAGYFMSKADALEDLRDLIERNLGGSSQ